MSALARRCQLSLAMVSELDLLGRTSEMARTYGIDFFSVLSRGSQNRVESMMLRLAHSQNYLAPSPNREQVGESEETRVRRSRGLTSVQSPGWQWW